MKNADNLVFISLFKEAYQKCFGFKLENPLSEPESNLFSNEILEKTGLVIGWKSLKNYSNFIVSSSSVKPENPSIATLDTLARYVQSAPATDETKRKRNESHYPYWYKYKEQHYESYVPDKIKGWRLILRKRIWVPVISAATLIILIKLLAPELQFKDGKNIFFTDYFHSVANDSLLNGGWFLKSKDAEHWNQRGAMPECLTLFTLRGDNWPDSNNTAEIKNLLLKEIPSGCFTTEIHLKDFVPKQNWQQAGIILLEDTNFTGKSIRLSVAYNDFTGGFQGNKEILIQAISSLGKNFEKPEEIAHKLVFNLEPATEKLIAQNLSNSALRIEKHDKTFRFLYSNGPMENSAFKEIATRDIDMDPKYVGLFALKGFKNSSGVIPAHFTFFSMVNTPCSN